MTLDAILARAKELDLTPMQALDAVTELRKYKDIVAKTTETTIPNPKRGEADEPDTLKVSTVTYTVKQIKTARPQLGTKYTPPPDVQARMDKEREDFWALCPFVTESERIAFLEEKHDCTKCDCEACDSVKRYYMKPEKYFFWLKEKEREFIKTIT